MIFFRQRKNEKAVSKNVCRWLQHYLSIFAGGSPVLYSPAPRGDCENCCVIREAKDIKFLLYTRSNPTIGKQLYLSSDQSRLRSINKSLPLIFYMHGFSESAPGPPKSSSYELRDGKIISFGSATLALN